MSVDEVTRASYVIVQAGGRGSRLGNFTANKPKCLLSINGEPLLYRLFRQYGEAQFIIVSDYHFDALSRYLRAVPPDARYLLVRATGKGSASGLKKALMQVPDDSPFILTWCDLYFEEPPDIKIDDVPVMALTDRFTCRWSVDASGSIKEESSAVSGIVGYFGFPHKAWLDGLPDQGEFVRYLADSEMPIKANLVSNIREFGTVSAVQSYQREHPSRFFNEIEFQDSEVIKRSRQVEFDSLLVGEAEWYERVTELGFRFTPRLRQRSPLTLDRVDGQHPFDMALDRAEQRLVLSSILETLSLLHSLDSAVGDQTATWAMYWEKTVRRLEAARVLIPFPDDPYISVSGTRCRNPLSEQHSEWFTRTVMELGYRPYAMIHGDPTFSNVLIDKSYQAWLIDPRGTFGASRLLGEARYDWAKALYSIEGNYDQFNRRRFTLRNAGRSSVELNIASNGWEHMIDLLFEYIDVSRRELEILHALIWLSLSGYVLDDFDSILAAFYKGVQILEHAERL